MGEGREICFKIPNFPLFYVLHKLLKELSGTFFYGQNSNLGEFLMLHNEVI